MNIFVSLVVLALYPLIAIRRYFEYKYTKSGEAQNLLGIAMVGIVALFLIQYSFNISAVFVRACFWVMALCWYFAGMLVFVRINFRLRGETPA